MGQYYIITNLTKQEYIHPHDLGTGMKLREFGESGYRTMFALTLLLADEWANSHIAIIGDYSTLTELKQTHPTIQFPHPDEDPFKQITKNYTNISDQAKNKILKTGRVSETNKNEQWGWGAEPNTQLHGTDTTDYRIINTTKKQTLTPTLTNNPTNGLHDMSHGNTNPNTPYGVGITAPLTALLVAQTPEHTPDWATQNPLIGTWAGDQIIITTTSDPAYTEHKHWDASIALSDILHKANT